MLRKGGRVIAVGDPHQAIYGFTGADSDALDLIKRDFNCITLDLTVTFRCPKTVVDFAHKWVSHIEAAPSAPDGEVSRAKMADFLKRNDLTAGSAVLCRVTKPLVSLAFKMITLRIPCRIEGRDVGKSLQKLMQRWKVKTLNALEGKIEEYLARETTKLLARKQETKLALIEDTVETIRVIISQCRKEGKHDVDDAVAYVDQIFGDNVSDIIVLSTIHKSKGREWPRVFWLDRANTCPSKWARQQWQQEQENNLCYVAATRAQEQLIELEPATERKAA
jgi:superfamily I DNA/RNA helicase